MSLLFILDANARLIWITAETVDCNQLQPLPVKLMFVLSAWRGHVLWLLKVLNSIFWTVYFCLLVYKRIFDELHRHTQRNWRLTRLDQIITLCIQHEILRSCLVFSRKFLSFKTKTYLIIVFSVDTFNIYFQNMVWKSMNYKHLENVFH